jgi:hypothetical protein
MEQIKLLENNSKKEESTLGFGKDIEVQANNMLKLAN